MYTLPETNSLPLKIVVSNRNLLLQGSIFRGYVSFREGIYIIIRISSTTPLKARVGHLAEIDVFNWMVLYPILFLWWYVVKGTLVEGCRFLLQ